MSKAPETFDAASWRERAAFLESNLSGSLKFGKKDDQRQALIAFGDHLVSL